MRMGTDAQLKWSLLESEMDDKELNKLLIENRKMREALEFIHNWQLPKREFNGAMVSYESARGSNGARDYMRKVASDALNNHYVQ